MSEPMAGTSTAASTQPDVPAPEITVVGAEAIRFAAAPTLQFAGHVTEPQGREVYTIALTSQIMVDPARRSYDDATRERLVDLFGPPERWATTTHSFLWAELGVLVPAFTGATSFRLPIQCNYDLELAATKYLYSLPDGEVPLSFNFTGTIFYRGDAGRMQIVKVPWDCSARFAMPVATWREMIEHYYPRTGWVALGDETLEALGRAKAERGLHSFDATVAELLRGPAR
jgi:Family of unknown function (DUF6084)